MTELIITTDTTVPHTGYRVIPEGHICVGTCGKCGGPVITPAITVTTWDPATGAVNEAPRWCMDCGAKPKKEIVASFGPIIDME